MFNLKLGTRTSNDIKPITNYYLHQNGYFVCKSRKVLKTLLLTSFLSISLFWTNEVSLASRTEKPTEAQNQITAQYWACYKYIKSQNIKLSEEEVSAIANAVVENSNKHSIPASLILAIIKIESGFNIYAISDANALGLMQVRLSAHKDKIKKIVDTYNSIDIFNISTNIGLGSKIIKEYRAKSNSWDDALLYYNGSKNNPNGYDNKVILAKNNIEKQINYENGEYNNYH